MKTTMTTNVCPKCKGLGGYPRCPECLNSRTAKEQAEEPLPRTTCSAWVAVSERLPADFQMVLMSGRHLGYYVGSIRDGRWRVYTPLHAGDGRRIMIEDIPSPEYWMPLTHLPNE